MRGTSCSFLILFLSAFVNCQIHPRLPNDAEYFWCSQLYDPYYPLDPLNITLPLVNVSSHFTYPQPSYQVLPGQSLFSNIVSTGNILIKANSSACSEQVACAEVFVVVAYHNTSIAQGIVPTDTQSYFTFPLSALPKNQSSQLQVSIFSSDKSILLHEQAVEINIFSPIDQQVYIDYNSKGLKVFEKPWIPVGFYFSWQSTSKKFVALAIDEVRNSMQTTLPYRPPTPPDSEFLEYMSLANAMRTRVHFDMYTLSELPNSAAKWAAIDKTIAAVKEQNGLLAYYIADEPDGAGFGMDPSILKEVYEYIKSQDPYHPVTLVLNCIHSAPRYVDCADIIMVDPYPIGVSQPVGCDQCTGVPLDVSNRIELVSREINNTKPVWAVIQAFGGPVEHWNRLPTWQEERSMSYLSIIHGARGIQYFLEGIPFSRSIWAECQKISLEINSISPAILSHDLPPKITCPTSQIHIAGYHEANKYCYTIVIANAENSPKSFSLSVHELQSFGNLTGEVLFENRNITIAGGTISDLVGGFGTHVYRVFYSQVSGGPTINVANILRNPSFEKQSNVGMADGMWPSTMPTDSAIVDPTESYHGYYSQRLTNANWNNDNSFVNVTSYIAAVPPNVLHEISFVAKASESLTVYLYSTCGNLQKSFYIQKNSDWNNCRANIELTSAAQCSFSIAFSHRASVWLDLFQLVPQ